MIRSMTEAELLSSTLVSSGAFLCIYIASFSRRYFGNCCSLGFLLLRENMNTHEYPQNANDVLLLPIEFWIGLSAAVFVQKLIRHRDKRSKNFEFQTCPPRFFERLCISVSFFAWHCSTLRTCVGLPPPPTKSAVQILHTERKRGQLLPPGAKEASRSSTAALPAAAAYAAETPAKKREGAVAWCELNWCQHKERLAMASIQASSEWCGLGFQKMQMPIPLLLRTGSEHWTRQHSCATGRAQRFFSILVPFLCFGSKWQE